MNFAIYSRKSYYSDTSESTGMQIGACRDYIARAFDVVSSVTPYEDDGYIRSDIDRPAMNRLRADIAAGLVDCVVIYRIDRICSNMLDFCNFYSYLKENEIKFVTVKDGIDTTTPIGEAMMYLAVIFSGIEIENDTLRVTDNMRHLAAAGFWCGGRPPVGYSVKEVSAGKKNHKILVPDPDGLAFKNQLIEILLSNNFSLQQMETYCRQSGIRTPSGKFLATNRMHQILTAPYGVANTAEMFDYFAELGCIIDAGSPRERWDGSRGIMVYGRTWEKRAGGKKRHEIAPASNWRVSIGAHEPTMDPALYLRIVAHFKSKNFDKKMRHETTLLKGVLRCKCGRLLSLARKTKKDGSVVSWYKCPRREREGVSACACKSIRAEIVDEKAREIFRAVEHDPAVILRYMEIEKETAPGAAENLRRRIRENSAKLDRLAASLAENGASSAAKYIVAQIEKLDLEQAALNRELAEARQAERRLAAAEKSAEEKRAEIARLVKNFDSFSIAEQNEIARAVVRSAVWDNETLFLTL